MTAVQAVDSKAVDSAKPENSWRMIGDEVGPGNPGERQNRKERGVHEGQEDHSNGILLGNE